MPLYEYVCLDCQKKFTRLQGFGQSESTSCPDCQGSRVQRAMSTFASFSKGEGGVTKSVGGSSCASCTPGSNCSTCH